MNINRFGFKAKTIDGNKQWGYGYFVPSKDNRRCLWFYDGGLRTLDIDAKTISQCTGLEDSEGNLIYENDYFEIIDSGHVTGRYLVQYHPKSMHFQIKNVYIDTDFSDMSFVPMWMEHGRKVRVIGNKWDNEEFTV